MEARSQWGVYAAYAKQHVSSPRKWQFATAPDFLGRICALGTALGARCRQGNYYFLLFKVLTTLFWVCYCVIFIVLVMIGWCIVHRSGVLIFIVIDWADSKSLATAAETEESTTCEWSISPPMSHAPAGGRPMRAVTRPP